MPRKTDKRKQTRRVIGLGREPTLAEVDVALEAAGIKGPTFTPIQLLGFILKLVLKDRITKGEIELITTTYQEKVKDWWGEAR